MNRQAGISLDDLGYGVLPSRQAQGVIGRANGGNVSKCLDKTLIAIGNAAGVDLLICPRIMGPVGQQAVKVSFARVSKRRVWNCLRPIKVEAGGSGQKEAAEAVAFCMDQLLSAAPKRVKKEKPKKPPPKKEKKKARPRNHYLGVTGLMVPAGRERFTGYTSEYRYSKHIDFDFSGGAEIFYERRKVSWLAFGVQFDYYSLGKHKKKKPTEEEIAEGVPAVDDGSTVTENPRNVDRLNLFNLGASLRFLYPGTWVEPYLKLAFGLTVAGARKGDTYPDVKIGSGFGANYQVRAGLMALFPYLGIFADLGLYDVLWFPNVDAKFDLFETALATDVCFTLNIGIAVVF